MNTDLSKMIENFSGMRVLVIGEAMLDSYLAGVSERLCREAPVPVVSVVDRDHVPGGAGNTAVNLQTLGAQVVFLSVIGDDPEGYTLRQALEKYGVSTDHLIVKPNRITLAKQRVIAVSQMVVRFDQGTTEPLDEETETLLIEQLEEIFPTVDAAIVSDYDYGILTPRVIAALGELQEQYPCVLVVDSKRLPLYRELNITAVKPNYAETLELLNLDKPAEESDRVAQMMEHGPKILELTNAQVAAITIDQDGALIFQSDCSPYRTYARPQPNTKAAGAGDTFVSALTLSLAAGAAVENAAEIASAAASIVVGKEGTSACYTDELINSFLTDEKFVTDAFQLAARMAAYRREGKKIVFTNGCFDILHRGHISYLNRAKAHGDVLIIGLNSDSSVSRLKGPNRPINTLEDRGQVLAALSSVDHIIPFDGDTPHDLIRLIQPDVFVKGGDYTREKLPEAALVEELGGKVEIMPFVQDRSTTGIIERIRKAYGDGAGKVSDDITSGGKAGEGKAGKSNSSHRPDVRTSSTKVVVRE